MKTITEAELLNVLQARVTEAESQTAVAKTLGIAKQSLSKTLAGKLPPGPGLIRALGYRRVFMYTKLVNNTKEPK